MHASGPTSEGENTVPTIVIIGGVAGGASAATRARRLNETARIILLEKDADVSFANCGMPYYIGGEIEQRGKLIVADARLLERRFRIEVRTRCEALSIDREARTVRVRSIPHGVEYDLPYDRLILAPGASPFVPEMDGVNAPNVFTLRSLADCDRLHGYLEREKTGLLRAVVVGAGFIGLEMVEQLHRRGLKVALLEALPQVLPPLDVEMAHIVEEMLREKGVDLFLQAPLASFSVENERVVAVHTRSGQTLPTDLVILGMGVRPNVALAQAAGLSLGDTRHIAVNASFQTSDPFIYAVGDAVDYPHEMTGRPASVALAGPANRAGRLAGQHAATGEAPAMGGVLGTAIVRVFGCTAAVTGLSMKAAKRAGIDATAVMIEAGHHAGYYPGAQKMILKVVYDPASGRVLGAQAVGGDGVDKRVDVIATVIHFNGVLGDLTRLDLAYAPPFGSARDPVHVVGFAGENQRAGLVQVLQPDACLDDLQVVDVRTHAEVEKGGKLLKASHIPLDELRNRLEELDSTLPTVVVCRSGLRGWVGARILSQSGFSKVYNLSGGMLMRAHACPTETLV